MKIRLGSTEMSNFLINKKSTKKYEEIISSEPEATQYQRKYAVKLFRDFVCSKYEGKTIEAVIGEIITLKKNATIEDYEDTIYNVLQEWINFLVHKKLCAQTIRSGFANLRHFLYYFGIKTDEQDIKFRIKMPKRIKEEKHQLTKQEYKKIIQAMWRYPLRQALFLVLGSSGLRIGEALMLRRKDLETTGERVKINVRPFTKTRTGRSTYMSNEAYEMLKKHLEIIKPDDFVFEEGQEGRKGYNIFNGKVIIEQYLNRVLKHIGLSERYESNGVHKITPHTFRAYFFTHAVRKHGENYAHRMTGHTGYLMEYDRMTEEEKLEWFIQLEPDLMIFDQTKNKLEIEKLRKENETIEDLRNEVKKLKQQQAESDKRIIDTMKKQGILPS